MLAISSSNQPIAHFNFEFNNDYEPYLSTITGHSYGFQTELSCYKNDSLEIGEFYKLVPTLHDDGFYDWYNFQTEGKISFTNRPEAVLHFLFKWFEWNNCKGQNLFR